MMNHFIYISTKMRIRMRIRIRMWIRARQGKARRGTDMKLINSFKHVIVRNGSS